MDEIIDLDLDRDELLTLREAADLLRVDLSTVTRWALRGRLATWKRVGRLVTCRRAAEALLVPLRVPGRRQTAATVDRRTEEGLRRFGVL